MPIEGGATKGRPKKQCGAIEWLKAYLANGPRLVNDIIRDAAEHTPSYSLRTLERIKPLAHAASLYTNGAKFWIDLDVSTPTVIAPVETTPGPPATLMVVPTIIEEAKEFVSVEEEKAAELAARVPPKFPEWLELGEIRALPPDEFMRNMTEVIATTVKIIKEHGDDRVVGWNKNGDEVYERYNNKEYADTLIAKVKDYKTVMAEKIFAAKSSVLREHEQKLVNRAAKLANLGTEAQNLVDTPGVIGKDALKDKIAWLQELSAVVTEELNVVRAATEPDGEFLEDPLTGLLP